MLQKYDSAQVLTSMFHHLYLIIIEIISIKITSNHCFKNLVCHISEVHYITKSSTGSVKFIWNQGKGTSCGRHSTKQELSSDWSFMQIEKEKEIFHPHAVPPSHSEKNEMFRSLWFQTCKIQGVFFGCWFRTTTVPPDITISQTPFTFLKMW